MTTIVINDKTYELLNEIGYGSYGNVYMASDIDSPDDKVAIKIFDEYDNFREEAHNATLIFKRLVRRLPENENDFEYHNQWDFSPLIGISPRDYNNEDADPPYAIAYKLANCDLDYWITNYVRPGYHEISSLYEDLKGTLTNLHSMGYAHRDIRPHNILVYNLNDPMNISFSFGDLGSVCGPNAWEKCYDPNGAPEIKTRSAYIPYLSKPNYFYDNGSRIAGHGYEREYDAMWSDWYAFGCCMAYVLTGEDICTQEYEDWNRRCENSMMSQCDRTEIKLNVDFDEFKDPRMPGIVNNVEEMLNRTYEEFVSLLKGWKRRRQFKDEMESFYNIDGKTYELEERLGKGGYGEVYKATNIDSPSDKVALKFFEDYDNFKEEAHNAKMLFNLPGADKLYAESKWIFNPVVGTIPHDYNDSDAPGPYVIAYEMAISDLQEWRKKNKPTLKQIEELFFSIEYTLLNLHLMGYAHRDIKPENILVYRDEKGFYFSIGDLGSICGQEAVERCYDPDQPLYNRSTAHYVSHLSKPNDPPYGTKIGNDGYEREYDAMWTDWYGFACCMIYAITGHDECKQSYADWVGYCVDDDTCDREGIDIDYNIGNSFDDPSYAELVNDIKYFYNLTYDQFVDRMDSWRNLYSNVEEELKEEPTYQREEKRPIHRYVSPFIYTPKKLGKTFRPKANIHKGRRPYRVSTRKK